MTGTGSEVAKSGRLSHSKQDIRERTRAYALRIIRLYRVLPKSGDAQVIGKQLLRSGTSVGAHIAEANRGKSSADFTCKIEGAMQELEESLYWMELLADSGIVSRQKLSALVTESDELIAILVSMTKKTRQK